MSSEKLSKEETVRLEVVKAVLPLKHMEYASNDIVQMVANNLVHYILTGK
jgi:hypothetical protein